MIKSEVSNYLPQSLGYVLAADQMSSLSTFLT